MDAAKRLAISACGRPGCGQPEDAHKTRTGTDSSDLDLLAALGGPCTHFVISEAALAFAQHLAIAGRDPAPPLRRAPRQTPADVPQLRIPRPPQGGLPTMTRIDMTTREWHGLIKPVVSHASSDKEFPELGVVRIEVAETAAYAVATDRYTIAAERWPLPADEHDQGAAPVHVAVSDAKATLKLFTHGKDFDPLLKITIDTAPIPIQVVGQARSVNRLAITIQSEDGTRLVLHDVRDPSRDPLSSWRKQIFKALTRPGGTALEGLDLQAVQLARWASAARHGERLTVYSGPEPGDPLLVVVEQHFAGLWAVQQYLDAPAKTRDELPWLLELTGADAVIDLETGERLDGGDS